MISYLDPILFPDQCHVYEVEPGRYVYPIFKNGSSSIQAMDYRQLNYTEIRNLREIDIFVRDPFERYVSGVQTYLNSMSSQLDRFTMLNIISQYLFLNRHFAPQFFWVLNLARFTDAWMHFLPMTDLVTATEYTFNQLSRDTELEAYFQKTKEPCEFRLSPLKGELYVITTKEETVKVEPPKKFNIYGDY